MDRPLKKRSHWFRYRYYWIGVLLFLSLLVYLIIAASGGRKLRVKAEHLFIEEVRIEKFLEYIDTEGIVQPSLTLKVNTRESGSVLRIVAEEGNMLEKGDTILLLENPELMYTLAEERENYESKRLSFREKELEMEKQSLNLRKSLLNARHELQRLENNFRLEQEEFDWGVKSKAQLDLAQDEYEHRKKTAELELESIRHDSVASLLRKELFKNDIEREARAYRRSMERLSQLAVRAPIGGQVSGILATPGQLIGQSAPVAEIKVLDPLKIGTTVSEYYIDRVVRDIPAYIIDQGKRYPLTIIKVNSEISNRSFHVDLAFQEEQPENVRIGKSYRITIELDQATDALVIPRGDFFPVTGGQWIYKLNEAGTHAHKTYITIGRQNNRHYEILSGLQAGDRVIATGYANFADASQLVLKGGNE